jgi:hypothetical protein
MPGIPLPTIRLSKKKETSQIMDVMTTDGRLVEPEIPVIASMASDDATGNSFLLDPNELYLCKDKTYHQLVSDKSRKPLVPSWVTKQHDWKKIAGGHVGLTYDVKRAQQYLENKKNEYMESLKIIVAIGATAFVIIAGMYLLWGQNG